MTTNSDMSVADFRTSEHSSETLNPIKEPWFHIGITREQATLLIQEFRTIDGIFLVRGSRTAPGSFVLTYTFAATVLHARITPIWNYGFNSEHPVYTLDSGSTRFYNIKELVEFYQLNTGFLPTRLTNYLRQRLFPYPLLGEQEQDVEFVSLTIHF